MNSGVKAVRFSPTSSSSSSSSFSILYLSTPSTTINRPPDCAVRLGKCICRRLYTFVAFAPSNFGQHSFLLLIASPLSLARSSILLFRATAIRSLHWDYRAPICESLVYLLYGLRPCVPLLFVSVHFWDRPLCTSCLGCQQTHKPTLLHVRYCTIVLVTHSTCPSLLLITL